MIKTQSSFFRTALFAGGGGIVALSFFLSTAGKIMTAVRGFTWISIAVMYLVFSTPFFFSKIRTSTFSAKIPTFALVWGGIIVYILASIVNIGLISMGMSLSKGIVAQLGLLFLFGVDVYFAYFASAHAADVTSSENLNLAYLSEMKTKAQEVLIAVKNLPPEYDATQKIIMGAIEECRYLSPVNNNMGDGLEQKITVALRTIEDGCNTIAAGGRPEGWKQVARNLQIFVKERKLLRN
ncbi:MAG: hypothetical protein LBG87_06270 [Spirochaetaceae bacterium]|jgi:hypothetical protein|nr:hypothetical protein [Spirochaetaceae bacterium]